ncbi:MAG: helix-turn-helix domain-containing protein [Verrucomicrobia bacterium]|nr:helix-turn-helix domain-containing protein [Verrucomicrobiota bacterium]
MNKSLSGIMMLLAQATPEKCDDVLSLLEGRAQLEKPKEGEGKNIKLLTIQEVMTLARCCYSTVYRAAEAGELHKIQLRGRHSKICFYEDDVLAWIERGIVGITEGASQNTEGGTAV